MFKSLKIRKSISIIIPAYNEEKNIMPLYKKLKETILKLKIPNYEIIFIDDGSADKTSEEILKLCRDDKKVKGIIFKRNYGQTAAISAGIDKSRGEIIILMDADLQNDPADIPNLLKKIEEGYDVVSGWRYNRKDNFLTRVLPSKIANYLISIISGVKLKDYGCTLKAYKKEFIKNIKIYGEMHRFIPIYAHINGAKITEIKVRHHPRRYGKSKYGLIRIFKVILDLLVVKFIESYWTKPIYFFGGVGFSVIIFSIIIALIVLIQKFFYKIWAHKNPLLTLAVMLFILGTQFILFGVLAEIEVRNFFEIKKEPVYKISKKINF